MTSRPTVVSLFAGCGGLDAAFAEDGFDIIYACDNDPASVDAYARNVDRRIYQRDVRSADFHLDLADIGCADIVLGGFPCQGFSKAGPKRADDERNSLYEEMLAAVATLRPAVFVAENVDGLVQNFGGAYARRILEDFRAIGYSVEYRVLEAAAFGLAQYRRRVFFVGTRVDCGIGFEWPRATHDVQSRNGERALSTSRKAQPSLWVQEEPFDLMPVVPLSAVIADLVELNQGVADHSVMTNFPPEYPDIIRRIGPGQKLCNVRHAPSSVYTWNIPEAFGEVSDRQRLILETIARNRRHKVYGTIPNGNPIAVSEIERLSGLRAIEGDVAALLALGYLKLMSDKYDLKGAMFNSGMFKRPRWEEPSPTVLTNFHSPRYFIHPLADRPFSLRECARIQGFPDSFHFTSDRVTLLDGYRLVGNAVPVGLARHLSRAVLTALQRSRTLVA